MDMLKRIITSIIGLIIFVAVIFSHQYVLCAAISLLVMGMLYEMYGAMDVDTKVKITGFCAAAILCVGFIFGKSMFALYGAIALFVAMMVPLHSKVHSRDILATAAVTIFISICMLSLIMIRKRCDKYTVILPFICAWLSDTGAYFTGTFIGKHKLIPHISPKKTVEGSIGGIVLATVGCVAYIMIMCNIFAGAMPTGIAMIKFAVLGFACAVISQIGDLIASCIKRDYDKKDYGSILPGHGGIMDRFDSVLVVTPVVYYAMIHFMM